MKITKSDFKNLLREALREYLDNSSDMYKLTYTTFLVDDDQQVADTLVFSTNIKGKFAQSTLDHEATEAFYFLKRVGNTVEEPQSVSDTETRIYYTDGVDDYYVSLQLIPQESDNEKTLGRRELYFLRHPFSWSERKELGRAHPLEGFYEIALEKLEAYTSLDAENGIVYVYKEDTEDEDDPEPFSEYSAQEECEFMDNLTQKYLTELQKNPDTRIDPYFSQLRQFLKAEIDDGEYPS